MTKFARKLAVTSVNRPPTNRILKAHRNPKLDDNIVEINPGPNVKTHADIEDWLKGALFTTYHTVGSASMLPREKGGIVDSRLKVYGTRNLRITDVSVIPLHFASHAQSVAYVISEKAADIISGKV